MNSEMCFQRNDIDAFHSNFLQMKSNMVVDIDLIYSFFFIFDLLYLPFQIRNEAAYVASRLNQHFTSVAVNLFIIDNDLEIGQTLFVIY